MGPWSRPFPSRFDHGFPGKATCKHRDWLNLGPFANTANVLSNTTCAALRGCCLTGYGVFPRVKGAPEPDMWFSEDS